MQALTSLPDLLHVFATIGGFATVYGAVGVGRKLAEKWRAAAASKTAAEDRIAAVETALRDLAAVLEARNKPADPIDQAKGAV
ncbi:hypothetical protein [Rhodoplanes serenus]|uniref:hypothetical protein n=1 Tax=Rhodoplanes serenus TaxID=200615 RepID=UPI000DABF980|nr:hypothetical protein [Rhodoplanes serenus]RAI31489.1 hypothetical protein CH340_18485 [Rhodoplanes serenus]